MARRTQGGKRSGAGRKPVADKLKPVTIYVRQSVIASQGIDILKDRLKAAINPILHQVN